MNELTAKLETTQHILVRMRADKIWGELSFVWTNRHQNRQKGPPLYNYFVFLHQRN
jgi:hypothetical protein